MGYFLLKSSEIQFKQVILEQDVTTSRREAAIFSNAASDYIDCVIEFRFLFYSTSVISHKEAKSHLLDLEKKTHRMVLFGSSDFAKSTVELYNALLTLTNPPVSSLQDPRKKRVNDALILWLRLGELNIYRGIALTRIKPKDLSLENLSSQLEQIRGLNGRPYKSLQRTRRSRAAEHPVMRLKVKYSF